MVRRYAWVVMAACGALMGPGVSAQSAAALQDRQEALATQLAQSPFQRPLVLMSGSSTSEPEGDVYAIVAHPFRTLAPALKRAEDWCGILILPANVKRCTVGGTPTGRQIQLTVGRKHDQPVADAYPIEFQFTVQAAHPAYLSVQMRADEGPLGTRAYRLTLEAMPLDGNRSFVHMAYSYANGLAARIATDAYLATVGRDKVGFSITGRDADGRPIYVRGIRGVAERNTMRYFLAIEAFLDTQSAPPSQRLERRLRDWFEATERYPRQLHEVELADYLAIKRRDVGTDIAANRGTELP